MTFCPILSAEAFSFLQALCLFLPCRWTLEWCRWDVCVVVIQMSQCFGCLWAVLLYQDTSSSPPPSTWRLNTGTIDRSGLFLSVSLHDKFCRQVKRALMKIRSVKCGRERGGGLPSGFRGISVSVSDVQYWIMKPHSTTAWFTLFDCINCIYDISICLPNGQKELLFNYQ